MSSVASRGRSITWAYKMDYLKWNDALASHFFSPEKDGRRVFLYVTNDLIQQLNNKDPNPVNDFISAILSGPTWTREGSSFCQKAFQSFDKWRDRNLKFPPYIAYLSLFVLAAGHEGNFAPHAYYPRLWKLLGQDKTGAPPSFREKMHILWDDLEHWSQYDMKGSYGSFNTYLPGDWIHVGLPTAQTILTEDEIRQFPEIFAKAELDPTSDLSDDELFSLISRHGIHHLRSVTLQFLRNPKNAPIELRNIFAEVLHEHLHGWDGQLKQPKGEQAKSYASLVLCCRKIDRVSGRFHMEIRCKTAEELPEAGLQLKISNSSQESFWISPSITPWSSPIVNNKNQILDAANIDWTRTLSMMDISGELEFRLRGKKLRIFVNAAQWGLPGYTEVDRIPKKETNFFLLIHNSISERIEKWAFDGGCKECTTIKFKNGLPKDWQALKIDTLLSDAGIKEEFPSLSVTESARIYFKNGIRINNGNTFFGFARPEIHVESNLINEVLCDGNPLQKNDKGLYSLPNDIQTAQRHIVEVRSEQQSIARKSIALEIDFNLETEIEHSGINKFGLFSEESKNCKLLISGAYVSGIETPEFIFKTIKELSDLTYKRITLLGKMPGQISVWPSTDEICWQPVWAILSQGRHSIKAVFCGTDLPSSLPFHGDSKTIANKEVKRWKEVLWHKRKRIKPPRSIIERKLWNQYMDVAKHV